MRQTLRLGKYPRHRRRYRSTGVLLHSLSGRGVARAGVRMLVLWRPSRRFAMRNSRIDAIDPRCFRSYPRRGRGVPHVDRPQAGQGRAHAGRVVSLGGGVMREILKLVPNVPVEIALQFATGKIVTGTYGDQVMYSLAGNKILYLDLAPAEKLNQLWVKPGETFLIVKRWTGKKTDRQEFDCWLSPTTEKARAEQERAALDEMAT